MIRQLAFAVLITFACSTAVAQTIFPRYEDFEKCAPAPTPCGPDQKFCGAAGVSFTNGEALQGTGVNPTVFIGSFCHDSCPSCGGLQFLFFRGLTPTAKRVSFDLWNESTIPFLQTISYTSSFIPPRFGTMMTVLLPPKVVTRVHLPPDQVVGGVLIWGGGAVDNLEWDEIVPLPPTSIEFALGDNTVEEERRVLINRWRDDDLSGEYKTGYWSKDQTADGKIVIRASVKQNGAPAANKPVYFRVTDPPDSAPYAEAFGDALDNDNHDKQGGTVSPNPAFTDSNGNVTTTLAVTTFAAGDNYRVEASLDAKLKNDPTFACKASTLCFKSGVMTAWKRMYYEFDHMFRRGAFLRDSTPAGADRVLVKKNDDLWKPGTTVRLIHAPKLHLDPANNPILGTKPQFFHDEDRLVKSVEPAKNDDVWLVFTEPLSGIYSGEEQMKLNGLGARHHLDAVGVITDPNNPDVDFYRSTFGPVGLDGATPVDTLFRDAFIDLKEAPQSFSAVPYVEAIAQAPSSVFDRFLFADRWFHQSVRSITALPKSRPNHLHVISASVFVPGDDDFTLGLTWKDHDSNYSYLLRGTMEQRTKPGGFWSVKNPLTGLPLLYVLVENAAHEIAHQWNVNAKKGFHCTEVEWNHPTRFCRMHEPWDQMENGAYKPNPHNVERGDGIMAFHYQKTAGQTDSEYLTIRRSAEPLP